MKEFNRNNLITNFFWRFFERVGAQVVSFLVTIVLARLLCPSEFGLIALVTIFTSILQVFIDSGMGNALIQKKDADNLDFSSVFFFNMSICIVLYFVLCYLAPCIARLYGNSDLTLIIRVLGLKLIVSGIRNIQQAYVTRHLLFRKNFNSTLVGSILSAVVGIGMAFLGYGVWALVIHHLTYSVIETLVLWLTVGWRPKLLFSFQRLQRLFSYGWKLLFSSLLDAGFRNLTALIIGKLYTAADLAFYDRGRQFPNLIVKNINTSMDSILFPTMSSRQDDKERVRTMTRRAITISTYLMMPIMMLLAVCAEPIVKLVLTEKWLPCVFFLRIFCFTFAFWPIHTANLNAIKALGRSDLFLKLEIIKKMVGLIAIFVTMYISVEAMALSQLVTSVLSQIINSWPNRQLLNYRYLDQVKDMLPQIGLSCVMGALVYCVQFLHLNDWLTLLVQILLGATFYLFFSWLLRLDSFEYIMGIAKGFLLKSV